MAWDEELARRFGPGWTARGVRFSVATTAAIVIAFLVVNPIVMLSD